AFARTVVITRTTIRHAIFARGAFTGATVAIGRCTSRSASTSVIARTAITVHWRPFTNRSAISSINSTATGFAFAGRRRRWSIVITGPAINIARLTTVSATISVASAVAVAVNAGFARFPRGAWFTRFARRTGFAGPAVARGAFTRTEFRIT